jgi:hypothetical protein
VTSKALIELLTELYRDRFALYQRHVEGATRISGYEFNNTYQYVISRAMTHNEWLRAALADLGAPVPEDAPVPPVPDARGDAAAAGIAADDRRLVEAFLERWAPKVDAIPNARHRKMLTLMLGEMREQARFFAQIEQGRDDLLGRRHANVGTGGGVLPVRWME